MSVSAEVATSISNDEFVLFEGKFPYDFYSKDPYHPEDKPFEPIKIFKNGDLVGQIEATNNYLKLIVKFKDGKDYDLWEYVDFGHVSKITQSNDEKVIHLYYSRSFFRDEEFVTDFFIETKQKKRRLLKRGAWNPL